MAEETKSMPDPRTSRLIKNGVRKEKISVFFKKYKKFLTIAVLIILGVLLVSLIIGKKDTGKTMPITSVKSVTTKVEKSYDFTSLNNQGKPNTSGSSKAGKIKLTVTNAEKTSQVLVSDKTFTAKNNKLFLILNLELRNDSSVQANLIPGDLIRLTYGGDENRKFAPDLHNNLVPVAAISTKLDRVGFVIPDNEKVFKIYIGELDGKKDIVTVTFGS